MRRSLVIGNWKMVGTVASVTSLLTGLKSKLASQSAVETVVCPPFIFLQQTQISLQHCSIGLGAQNVSEHSQGAYTGEIAADMLAGFDCKYCIVGHSERRSIYQESDQVVAAKFLKAQEVGLKPILCVGESLAEREAGQTLEVVSSQVSAVVNAAGVSAFTDAVVAYEPVWAIGTGKTASPQQAQEVHQAIRALIAKHDASVAESLQILYGGSVKPDNAAELFSQEDIDGALVGGASLKEDDFAAIVDAANA